MSQNQNENGAESGSSTSDGYRRLRIASIDAVSRERLLAEAFEAGAGGAEDLETGADASRRFEAWVYLPTDEAEAIRAGLLAAAGETDVIGSIESLPEIDWSEAWKAGLDALRVSERLVVRPPFVAFELEPGQREIVIDPGQAFGTGAHASTALCLEWIDELVSGAAAGAPGLPSVDRMLDVGTGSGVLALAAVALGCPQAVGFDLDPVAIEAAEVAARDNGLADRVELFVGPIDDVPEARGDGQGGVGFPLVVANLLKREMLPIATALADRLGANGRLVLAGLLEEDAEEVLARFAQEGLREVGRRARPDATGVWIAPCLARV